MKPADRWRTGVRSAALGAISALTMPSVGWSADVVPIPGYWEITSIATLIISSKTVEQKCFTDGDISKFLQGPSNRHYTCTYPTRVVGDGHILLQGRCVTKRGQVALISARGDYSAEHFRLTARLRTKIAGAPLAATATTTARRIGDTCPDNAPS